MNLNFYSFIVTNSKNNDGISNNPIYKGLFIAALILTMARTVSFGQTVFVPFYPAGTYSWTCPVGVTTAIVQCWGAGGAGGGAKSGVSDTAGGGGGGGAFVIDTLTVSAGITYSVTVGAGGLPGVSGTSGGMGGASWFSSTSTVYAAGGTGGKDGASGVGGYGQGGAGGAAFSCIPAAYAISGSNGLAASHNDTITSGAGGDVASPDTSFGAGSGGTAIVGAGNGTGPGNAGNAGGLYGGGGSGGLAGTTDSIADGGAGADGLVIITYTPAVPVISYWKDIGLNAKAFPNPASGSTTVQFSNETARVCTLKVLDLTGRILINKEDKAQPGLNDIRLDMNNYAKGIYLLNLQSGDNNQVIKLIVQ